MQSKPNDSLHHCHCTNNVWTVCTLMVPWAHTSLPSNGISIILFIFAQLSGVPSIQTHTETMLCHGICCDSSHSTLCM